ncbi:MAG: uroporphyrinogen decarboxylase family protein [bacterium]
MAKETVRSRFQKVLKGEMPDDRLPLIEWTNWWNLTTDVWEKQGLPAGMSAHEIKEYFGLDMDYQIWFGHGNPPEGLRPEGRPLIENEDDYERVRPYLYPDPVGINYDHWNGIAQRQAAGEVVMWMTIEGFFWWPRVLFGIEPHFYAFYDYPELMHRINQDEVDYCVRCIKEFLTVCTPEFATFAEDMSYNHGVMCSKALFDEFIAPYYRQVVPLLKENGISVIVDSDGDVEPLIPWMEEVGVEGILPLERMAGVDVNRIRSERPNWKMLGAYDKTIMHKGVDALRAEFERLMPVMKSGYFIPSVDHQTPPAVSVEDYRLYMKLYREYAEKACK